MQGYRPSWPRQPNKTAIKYPVIALLAFPEIIAPPLKCLSQGVKRDGTCEELTRKVAVRLSLKDVSSSSSFDTFLFKRERERDRGISIADVYFDSDRLNVLTDI